MVILAGYGDRMDKFFSSNPRFRSRMFSVSRMDMEGIVFRRSKGPVRAKAPINIVSRRNDSAAVVSNFLI